MALKPSSQIFTIGAEVDESGANTFTQTTIDIQLNPLDNEVLAIYAVDIQLDAPDNNAPSSSANEAALTTNTRTSLGKISQSQTVATAASFIRCAAGSVDGVPFESRSMVDSPTGAVDYIQLVATSDLFFGVKGSGNTNPRSARCKIWARRMTADAATYAALVQSELLSAN